MSKMSSRAEDDVLLEAIHGMIRGKSSLEFAKREGKGSAFFRIAMQRVLAADMAESGEPAEVVSAAYQKRVAA